MPIPPTQKTRIGLIATGDELIQGDIIDTNGQFIATQLLQLGFVIHRRILVDDNENHISEAIKWQLQDNDIIIISGGLGPTSDDRTRFALARALDCELIFNAGAWQAICQRLYKPHVKIDESNHQQALLPKDAEMLHNPNGSAAGCYLINHNKQIFMLPGPPQECLPMFEKQVIAKIINFSIPTYRFNWLLLGANEGEVAAKLDAAVKCLDCQTGYRCHYPYLEFKVHANDEQTLQQAKNICEPLVESYLVSKAKKTTKQQLQNVLDKQLLQLYFSEQPLAQYVKMQLLTASNHLQLCNLPNSNYINIAISGLSRSNGLDGWTDSTGSDHHVAMLLSVEFVAKIRSLLSLKLDNAK